MRSLRLLTAVALAPLLLGACRLIGYGDARDGTRFVSVAQNERSQVLYTVQHLVYRPAAGVRAFPDGGIPWYVTDRNVVGLLEPSGSRQVLYTRENTEWQHGQGQLTIHSFAGGLAVIAESGQRRDDYATDVHYYFLNIETRKLTALPLRHDLEARGRDVGYFYLIDARGTLLFVTPRHGAGKVETPTNEIWLRTPSGAYLLIAKGADLYAHGPRELVYWELESRKLWAYEPATGEKRLLDKYVPPAEVRPDSGIKISTDGKALDLSRRIDDRWRYERTILTLDRAK